MEHFLKNGLKSKVYLFSSIKINPMHTYKKLLLCFLAFTTFCGYSQDYSKFQLGLNYSQNISFIPNSGYNPKLSLYSGVNFVFNFSKNLGLETGAQFSNKGFQSDWFSFFYEMPEKGIPYEAKFKYNYNYLDIPLKLNLTLGSSKIRFISSVGLVGNIPLYGKSVLVGKFDNGREKIKDSFKVDRSNLSTHFSLGIGYQVSEKFMLKFEPNFRYSLLNFFRYKTPSPLRQNTYHFITTGLYVGIYYGL